MTDQPVSQREIDILRDDVRRMNEHGTLGVQSLQVQLTDAIKDITELKTSMEQRFNAHLRDHEQEKRDRVSGRRWLIAMGAAYIASMSGILGILIELLSRLH